ncbi:MAG: hypothetical protein V1944_00985 [Candidatus Aenigmatarchaeota archaeon]
MPFTIGVSSGIFGIAKEGGHDQAMQFAGIPRKAMYSITKGVNFIQVDLESISEFLDPAIREGAMKNVEKLGIQVGIHSETPAFGQREFPHLDSAIEVDYRRGHERLWTILEGANKINSKYVLTHSSESTPFIFLSRELQPSDLVDVWGRTFRIFMEEQKDWLDKWIWNRPFIWLDILHDTTQGHLERAEQERILGLREFQRRTKVEALLRAKRIAEKNPDPELFKKEFGVEPQEVLSRFATNEVVLTEEEEKEITEEAKITWAAQKAEFWKTQQTELTNYFKRLVGSRTLNYGPERIAYYIIAKWMERNNDPLWDSIINVTIKYYAIKDATKNGEKPENVDVEAWWKAQGIKKDPTTGKWTIEDDAFRNYYQLWVPAVSAKYVWGHFMQDECPDGHGPYVNKDPKKLLKEKGLLFLFETPMAGHGMEDLLRFPQPAQMFYLIKEIKSEYIGIAIDLEHLLMDGIDPDIAFDILPEGCAKYIWVLHSGWPSPLGPAHIPIPVGSEQHQYLYKKYYELRQKGLGKDPKREVYIIFERGGGEDPIKQSVLALRLIKQFLEKDVPPNKLPLEFFGIEPGQVASEQRQWAIIEDHGRDPLKGLLVFPEEEHGQLGKSAIEKGKRPEEFKKEQIKG